jgi:hypothetical protein
MSFLRHDFAASAGRDFDSNHPAVASLCAHHLRLGGILLIPTSDQRDYTGFAIAENTMQETNNFTGRSFRCLRA